MKRRFQLRLACCSPRRRCRAAALAIDPPAQVLAGHGRAARPAPGPCRPPRRAASCCRCRRPTRTAFPAASSMSPRSRPGSARRRSGSTAALPAARSSSSSAGSAARSSPRSRIPASAPPARRRAEQRGRARQLRLFDDLDGRRRRRDRRRPAAGRRRRLPRPATSSTSPRRCSDGGGRRVPAGRRAQRRRPQFGPRLPATISSSRRG